MKVLGAILMVIGALVLVYGGISYNKQRTLVDIGGVRATTSERHRVPLSPVVGGIALAGGILLLLIPRSRA